MKSEIENKKLFFIFSIDYQLISHRKKIVATAVENGYDVTVVAKDTGYRHEIELMGVRFIELPINRVGRNLAEELRTLLFLYRLYRKEKPAIVHHVSLKVVVWGGVAAKLANVHAMVNAINGLGVFFENGKVDTVVKKVAVMLLRFSHSRKKSIIILQNDDDRDFFVGHNIVKREQTKKICGSGVDLNEFGETPLPTTSPMYILLTARMIKEKGVLDVIKAAQILKPKYEGQIVFLLCGLLESNPKAVSKEVLDSLCDGNYIQYLGQRNDVKALLEKSSLVLLPSYYREGVPKALIEAAAIGRPIITTDWVGCRDTVIDGVNGFLVPIKSPEKIAEKIEILINNNRLRASMGKESRKNAVDKFSIEDVVKVHMDIYKEVTKM